MTLKPKYFYDGRIEEEIEEFSKDKEDKIVSVQVIKYDKTWEKPRIAVVWYWDASED